MTSSDRADHLASVDPGLVDKLVQPPWIIRNLLLPVHYSVFEAVLMRP
jgi:hypothetical protein